VNIRTFSYCSIGILICSFIIVHPEGRADGGKSSSGSLYVSDADGYKFTKALDYVHTIDNYWDVELVRSVEGTLFA